jgi:hypothetical protein
MKKLLSALALASLAAPAMAQTVLQEVQLNALTRIVGVTTLKYEFCTYANGSSVITVQNPARTGSGSGRDPRPIYYKSTIQEVTITDSSGTVYLDVLGPLANTAVALPVGCYFTLTEQVTGTGTANQGIITSFVTVPYLYVPPPPAHGGNDD